MQFLDWRKSPNFCYSTYVYTFFHVSGPSANKENLKNLSFNLQSLGTSISPTIKETNKLSKQTANNELVLPQRRTRYGNMSKKNNNIVERSINQMETEMGKNLVSC